MNIATRSQRTAGPVVLLLFAVISSLRAEVAVRPDHPRVYFNKETFPEIKRRCEGSNKPIYEKMKTAVDILIADPSKSNRIRGVDASMPAFCFLMTGDKKYVAFAKQLLEGKIEHDEWNAAALDWLHDELTDEEFKTYALKMISNGWKLHNFGKMTPWWNQTYTWRSGLAPVSAKALAIFGEGVDDAAAASCVEGLGKFLKETFLVPTNVTEGGWPEGASYFEGMCVGDVIALGLAAWKSATGEDLFKQSAFLKGVSEWFLYITVPHVHANPMVSDGAGADTIPGRLAAQILSHEYGDPISARAARVAYTFGIKQQAFTYYHYHVMPLVLWGDPTAKTVEVNDLPPAKLYAPIGWVTMRSDWSRDATFALLKLGDWFTGHQHMDAGSFIIAHKGHLAIDSGVYSTYAKPETDHVNYYKSAIAHNTIAISNPHPLKHGWKLDTTSVWDFGGQHALESGTYAMPPHTAGHIEKGSPWDTCDVLAYEANDVYSYVAADVSGAYRPELLGGQKIMEKFTRQFVYLRPGLFIVYDRVTTTDPKYTKRFVLHVMNEPKMAGKQIGVEEPFNLYNGDNYVAADGNGQLAVMKLLPKESVFKTVGGEGFEFWANGRQHPVSTGWHHFIEYKKTGKWASQLTPGWGRIETQPQPCHATDNFLHVLLASDMDQVMPKCRLVESEGFQGAKISGYGDCEYVVTFTSTGNVAGQIKITQGAQALVSRSFSAAIKEGFERLAGK